MLRNIERLADYADEHDLDVRPHTKTHKSRQVGDLQMAAGAVGLTAAKVGEAELMAEVADDILLAYPAIDPARTARLAQLAGTCARRASPSIRSDGAKLLGRSRQPAQRDDRHPGRSRRRHGTHRTADRRPKRLKLAQYVDATAGPAARRPVLLSRPHRRFRPAEQEPRHCTAVSDKLAETLRLWCDHGLQARIVSGGSTPTAFQSHLVPEYTEIRPGTYIYNDMNTVRGGYCKLDDCAARIVCTVVSTAVPGQVVIDAGSKTLTSDLCGPRPESGHGYIVEYPEARIAKLTEEHGQVDIRDVLQSTADWRARDGHPQPHLPLRQPAGRVWWRGRRGAAARAANRRPRRLLM